MLIPQGTWCVVRRPVRGEQSTNRGEVIKGGLTQSVAQRLARQMKVDGWDYWAIDRKEYDEHY